MPINFIELKKHISSSVLNDDDIIIMRSYSNKRCHLYIVDQHAYIEDHILYSFQPNERNLVYDMFLMNLLLDYEFPLNGYVMAATPYAYIINSTVSKNTNEHLTFFNCEGVKPTFLFYVCTLYSNSLPILIDELMCMDIHNYHDCNIFALMNVLSTIRTTLIDCTISNAERCILNKYSTNLISRNFANKF